MRTAASNEKGTARRELIEFVHEVTGRSIEDPQSTEDETESQPTAEKEYCHFMLRAPKNETVINSGKV